MPHSAAITLVEQAKATRAEAQRAQRLAWSAGRDDITEGLQRYADELERKALDLEDRATSILENLLRMRELTKENCKFIEEIKDRIRQRHGGPCKTR
jgi:hypothetical protein